MLENSVTTLADYFVLCTGTSAPQLKALADAGERAMKEAGILPPSRGGGTGRNLDSEDYGDVVVHLFDKEARAFYDLDRLWGGCQGGGPEPGAPARRVNPRPGGFPGWLSRDNLKSTRL